MINRFRKSRLRATGNDPCGVQSQRAIEWRFRRMTTTTSDGFPIPFHVISETPRRHGGLVFLQAGEELRDFIFLAVLTSASAGLLNGQRVITPSAGPLQDPRASHDKQECK